jgi:peptidoglycan hydrolase CwlO-like protein
MDLRRAALQRALAVAVAAGLAGAGAALSAGADDLESLRERARSVADQVTALEHRLERLRARHGRLQVKINAESREIGQLELEISEADQARRAALSRYVERAVELYKMGGGMQLALLLSARSLTDMVRIANLASAAARVDRRVLEQFQNAVARAEAAQVLADARKRSLLAKQRAIARVAQRIRDTLAERRIVLAELIGEIERLEALARAQALSSSLPLGDVFGGPSPDIPDGYVSTGVSFEGVASWYGPGFEGNTTANGEAFDPGLYTAASRDLPFNTILHVVFQGRGVVVRINDRGPYVDDRILDLSRAAAEAIGLGGIGWVRATIIVPEVAHDRRLMSSTTVPSPSILMSTRSMSPRISSRPKPPTRSPSPLDGCAARADHG